MDICFVNLSALGLPNSNIDIDPSECPANKYESALFVHIPLMHAFDYVCILYTNSGGCYMEKMRIMVCYCILIVDVDKSLFITKDKDTAGWVVYHMLQC